MKNKFKLNMLASSIVCSLVVSTPIFAEEEEIIFVTSDKMGSATLQEMPVTIKLLSSEELEEKGIIEFLDYAGSIPSLQFQDLGPGDKEFIIRGVNSSGPSTVGVYFDETPITGSNAQDGGGRNVEIKLIDVEKIEVFNGPQGTQYGANSMSGLIRYIPVKPDLYESSGFVDADFSTTDKGGNNTTFSGAVNIPVIEEKLAVRLIGWNTENDGWIDQPRHIGGPQKNINDESTTGGRIMVRYAPTDELMIDGSYLTQEMTLGGSSRYVPKGESYTGLDDNTEFPKGIASNDYENYDLGTNIWDEDLALFSLTASYEFDLGRLTASTSKFEREIDFSYDFSSFYFTILRRANPSAVSQPQSRDINFSEIRYSSDLDDAFQFFIGASTRTEDNRFQSNGVLLDEFGMPTPFSSDLDKLIDNGGNVIFGRYFNFEIEQQAYFGEVSYEVNDDLIITAGARYFTSKQTLDEASTARVLTEPEITKGESQSKPTYKLSAAYNYDTDINFYATVSQGFRVGGVNNTSGIDPEFDVPDLYQSDFLTNYELGFKTQFNDKDITFNGSIYHIDWEDMQVESEIGFVPFITNAGEASVDGMELNLSYFIGEHVLVELNGSYTDAKLTKDQPEGGEGGKKGDSIPNIPKTQLYAGISYIDDTNWGELTLRADVTHRGDSDIRFDPSASSNYNLDSSNTVSVRAVLSNQNGWTGTFYIRNLTNEIAEYDAINSGQDPLAVVSARPRTIGFKIKKSF